MAVSRVEKNKGYTVMSNYHLQDRKLTLKAKGMLSLMLSLPDTWDYTLRGLAAICVEGIDGVRVTVKELENNGYITRHQGRDQKGKLSNIEYVIYEQPCLEKPYTENPITATPCTALPHTVNPTQLSNNQVITQKEITDLSNTQSIYPAESNSFPQGNGQLTKQDTNDRTDAIDVYREIIYENIEYDIMCGRYDKERVDEIAELILETVCSTKKTIRIGGDDFPAEVVKSRFLKLTESHIEYVFDRLDKNTTKVRNIKSYLLTTLYNAPATIDHYYRAEVNHDLYGGGRD